MTDLLLFTLCFLASILVVLALFRLTRPEKVEVSNEKPGTTKSSFRIGESPLHYEFKETVYYMYDRPHKPLGWKTAKDLLDNEDTRPLPPHEDSFSHEELWEAPANIPRESAAQKQQIDKWVNEALDAGEDYEL